MNRSECAEPCCEHGATSHSTSPNLDRVGVFLGAACAVHCLLSALVPSVLVGLGLGAFMGHKAEWTLTILAVVFVCIAIATVWVKHRTPSVLAVLLLGVCGLIGARFAEEHELGAIGVTTSVLAGLVLALGHVMNMRAHKRSRTL